MIKKINNINKVFRNAGIKIVKFKWILIAAVIIFFAAGVFGFRMINMEVSIDSYFLDNDPLKRGTDEFEKIFGNNDYIALLIESDDVFKPEIMKMIRELGKELEQNVPFADEVVSLTDIEYSHAEGDSIIIDNLIPDEIPSSSEKIEEIRKKAFSKKTFLNKMVSEDSKNTWLMLKMEAFPDNWKNEEGLPPDYAAGKKALEIIKQEKYSKYNIKATGMPVIAYEKQIVMKRETMRSLLLAFAASIIFLVIFLRSFVGVIVPLITTITSIVIVFGAMGFLKIKIDPTFITIPVFLGIAVSIGYSIHLFNFFKRHFKLTGKRKESVYYAVENTGWPIFFTALTTIGALLSFYFVPLTAIRWIGLTSAALILVIYLAVMTITPVLLSFGKDKKIEENINHNKIFLTDKIFITFNKWVNKYSIPIVIVFCVIIAIGIFGLTKVEINQDYEHSLGFKIPYVKRVYDVGMSKIGSLYAYNVTLTFKEPDKIYDPETLKKFQDFSDKVEKAPLTKRVSSILDIIKDMNKVFHNDSPEYYKIPENKDLISQLLLLYEMSGGTNSDDWYFNNDLDKVLDDTGAGVTNNDTNEFDDLLAADETVQDNKDHETMLRLMVEVQGNFDNKKVLNTFDLIKQQSKELFPDAELAITGSLAQFMAINDIVAFGQIKSFVIALFVIMVLMMIVFKSIKIGLIGLIPNITPAIIVGGAMGLLKIPLDMITITIMPMILGLAVDDTIHFISHARFEYEKSGNYEISLTNTFKTVGRALFMTSMILCVTYAMYLTSIVNMIFNLGAFVVLGISSALAADYLITPILIKWTKPFDKMLKLKKELKNIKNN